MKDQGLGEAYNSPSPKILRSFHSLQDDRTNKAAHPELVEGSGGDKLI
jgi:hypothetical protein